MNDLEPEAKAKQRIDNFVYGAVALGMVGINVGPWFEAQSEISIMKAKADARIYVLRAELELEKEKRKISPQLQDILKLLQGQVDSLKLDSHKPKE